ncbi:MAG: AAA family ATPase [Candidatus Methanofastidiosa archaeon]|nr:AAA family ATPase [Candidatus Methanofastidiosa archaeon]
MIRSIKIKNYQSHENSELHFSDGVNVIVGHSDSGKSAIIRALRWACWNRPNGNSFCSTWGGATSVELETEEGKVLRLKDKKDKYVLTKQDERDTSFEAFGTNVPDEIASFLNMDEINLQFQLDSPFLLSQSPGQIAEHFNKIAKLDQIDRGLFNINKAIRGLESDRKYKQDDVTEKEKQLLQYEHLEKFEAEIEVLEDLESVVKQKQSAINDLTAKLNSLESVNSDIGNMQDTLEMEEPLLAILDLIDERDKKDNKIDELNIAIIKLEKIESDINEYQNLISDEKEVNDLIKLTGSKKVLVEKHTELSEAVDALNDIEYSLEKGQAKIESLQAEYDKGLKELKICPLCGNKIK